MRRPPNLSISQWFSQNALLNETWIARALCRIHPELPWTDDATPGPVALESMAIVCSTCPVLRQCAHYAVHTNNDRGIDGGFWAGHWMPWNAHNDSAENKRIRTRSRRLLRVIIGERKPIAEPQWKRDQSLRRR